MMLLLNINNHAQMMKSPAEKVKELKQKLNLTNEQTEKVEQIYEDAEYEFRNRIQGSGNRDQIRTAMQTLMNNTDVEILKILNDEQKEIYDSIMEARKRQMEQFQRNFNH
jgi:hypothetical protein